MNTEQAFLRKLKGLRQAPFGWAVVQLKVERMDSAKAAMFLNEKARARFMQLEETEGITPYFCVDGDVFFLFKGMHGHSVAVIRSAIYSLLPYVNHEDVVLDDLFELYVLSDRFERVFWLAEQRAQQAEEGRQQAEALAAVAKPVVLPRAKELNWSAEKFTQGHAERTQRHQKQIFIVDDDEILRDVAVTILMHEYAVQVADDAHSALTYYNRYVPDLVFLDIGLPDENGLKLLEMIVKNDPWHKVVMFSGNKKSTTVQQALEIGAKGYLVKPFQPQTLLKYTHKFLTP